MINQTISHYKILDKLGEGGMGVIYKAHDLKLDRFVALKFLPRHLASDEQDKERFVHEAKAASSLDHPNICTVHEIDETPDGQLFIAMAIYDGSSLSKKIEKSPLKIEDVLDIATQVAEGLQAAHEKGITHRDIKSSNVIVTEKGRAIIMDFGLARSAGASKFTKTGSTLGTVPYMSPEQARGEKVDHRSDIWSLGAVIYEMVTGQLPFRSQYDEAIVYSILNENPQPLTALRSGIPLELERIVYKCLEKNPSGRYQHADELMVDLRKLRSQTGEVPTSLKSPLLSRNKSFMYAGVGIALLLAAVLTLPLFTGKEESIKSIAVLPFENLSGDPAQEYFVDGMTEALIADLGKISALRVISRTSVMQYKGARKPLPQIARELKADALVEGSVLRAGERVRITAQLIHAATDRHLWAESYERDLRDVLGLQGEVAWAISREIRIKLTPEEQAHLASARPVNPEVYQLYLKGRFHWNKRTEEGLKKSLEYFQQAIQIDPGYAPAYSGLADSYLTLTDYDYLPTEEASPRARSAAKKALEIDEKLAEAHNSLAHLSLHDWEWSEAEREFKRAIELDPGYTLAYHWYALCLTAMGRPDEAIAAIKKAQELDPLSLRINADVGMALFAGRKYDEAIEQERKTIELDPKFRVAHWIMGMAYEQKRMFEEAINKFREALSLSPGNPNYLAAIGHAYALAGKEGEARKVLEELKKQSKQEHVSPFFLALVYAGLNEKDPAFEWLEKAYQERSGSVRYLKVEPRTRRPALGPAVRGPDASRRALTVKTTILRVPKG